MKSTSTITRSQGILNGFRGKIKRLANQYQNARQALSSLDPTQKLTPNWGQHFFPLKDCDLRGPMHDETQPSEGQMLYSWIWVAPSPPPLLSTPSTSSSNNLGPTAPISTSISVVDVDSQGFDQVHWTKCQARVERYEEEVQPSKRWDVPSITLSGSETGGCLSILNPAAPTTLPTFRADFVPTLANNPICTTCL